MQSLALKRRTFKSVAPSVAPNPYTYPIRDGPCKQWTDETMARAITAVVQEAISISKAAEMYQIPRSTLHDHLTGRVEHGSLPGPARYLSMEEEEEIVSFLIRCAKIGYPHTRHQIMGLVQGIVSNKGIHTVISDGWWERFRKRHPNITLREAASLSYARAMASDRECLSNYYDLLEDSLKINGVFDDPSCIFNCDETGMPLCPPSPKVIDMVGSKNPSYLTGGTKAQITVLACACAAGYAIPPFVIFDWKTLIPQLTKGEVPGTSYGLSSNGWIDRQLFTDWFFHHFLEYVPSVRPLVLLLDGHTSHYSPEVIKMGAAEEIVVIALPPNTTHLLQALDKGIFGPLKSQWKKVVQSHIAKHGKAVTRYEFSSLFADVWYSVMIPKNIHSGFKVCGVFPFNRDTVALPSEQHKASFKPETVLKKSKLKYIPLYSPAPVKKSQKSSQTTPSLSSPLNFSVVNKSPSDYGILDRRYSYSESSLHDLSYQTPDVTRAQTPDLCMMAAKRVSQLDKFLVIPTPPVEKAASQPKPSGRILTSQECIKSIEEKERKQKEKLLEKDLKKKQRKEKKKQAQLIKRQKPVRGEYCM